MHIYQSFGLTLVNFYGIMRYYLLFVLLYSIFHSYAVVLLFIFVIIVWRVKTHNGRNQFVPTYYEMILHLRKNFSYKKNHSGAISFERQMTCFF